MTKRFSDVIDLVWDLAIILGVAGIVYVVASLITAWSGLAVVVPFL